MCGFIYEILSSRAAKIDAFSGKIEAFFYTPYVESGCCDTEHHPFCPLPPYVVSLGHQLLALPFHLQPIDKEQTKLDLGIWQPLGLLQFPPNNLMKQLSMAEK